MIMCYCCRVTTTVLCNMDLHRFPHDKQGCSLKLESWTLETDDMMLIWESINELEFNQYMFPGYTMTDYATDQQIRYCLVDCLRKLLC